MESELLYSRFADVALTGLNIRPGQSLAIKMKPEQMDVAVAVASEAYRRGVRYVDMWPESERFHRSRLENSREEYLDYLPGYRALRNAELLRDKWALLSLKSPVYPTIFDDMDSRRTGIADHAMSSVDAPMRRGLGANITQWLVMPPPAPQWAMRVMDISDPDQALQAMWEVLIPILHLDREDAGEFWRRKGAELQKRAEVLTDLNLRALRMYDEGTEIEIPLHESAIWHGGGSVTQDGVPFSPNIPTEEVYTAPFALGVTGKVAVTRPVRVMGGLVKGATFRFEGGNVVEYDALAGRDLLTEFLSGDEGSLRMGEIALVDDRSPISTSGLVFENILLDENAACHFALGSAYPSCLRGGTAMSDEELEEVGANRSRQHLDFMIGSDDTDVDGLRPDGSSIRIISKGKIVL